MKEYGTYIFDLDNTIVDSSHGLEIALRAGFKEYGIPYDPSKYSDYITTPLREIWEMYRPDDSRNFDRFFEIVIENYDEHYREAVKLFPDAEECLTELHERGKKMGIVSNSLTPHITGIMERLGLEPFFGSFVGADRCPEGKPDPRPVILCLQELDSSPHDSLMIGDAVNDVTAGRKSGTDTAFLDRKGNRTACNATFTISDLREILSPFHRYL